VNLTNETCTHIVQRVDLLVRLDSAKLCLDVLDDPIRILEAADAEVEPYYGTAARPVPRSVNVQPFEQRLVALEQLLQRADQQTLPEPPRAGEEVAGAVLDQRQQQAGLVHVIGIVLAQAAEGLDADGEELSGHG